MRILNENDISAVLNRNQLNSADINRKVKDIVENVRNRGDIAVKEYALKFDNTDLDKMPVAVTEKEFEKAYLKVDDKLLASLRKAIKNILSYHSRNPRKDNIKTSGGRTTGYIFRPVESAGVYVPGGTAAYPSSLLMGVLPAKAAGVGHISVITPAKNSVIHPLTLVAAKECGVDTVYRIGGAHAVAALAFGTQAIKKADIIAGPGNIFVSLAKKEVYGHVGIDMIAGPSEILIICDKYANAAHVAADLLSQAEHDALSAAYAVTNDAALAKKIAAQVEIQLKKLPRADIAAKSIAANGAVIVAGSLNKAAEISNKIAPEHLELCVQEPEELLKRITNAGAVFLGYHTPESVGDYFAGPCHILPTSGSAKFFQVLNQDTFLKKISVIKYSGEALKKDGGHIIRLAESEGLAAHANAVKIRLEDTCENS